MRVNKKVIIGALVALLTLSAGGVSVYAAAGHKNNCSSNLHIVECVGPYNYTQFDAHVLYESANGTVWCTKTAMYGGHDIYCANSQCGGFLGSSFRTHEVHHTYCPTETGLCQY